MINAKMWLVVKPTVGLPLIIGGAAVAAVVVHLGILLNTTWFPAYWQNGGRSWGQRTSEVAPSVVKPVVMVERGAAKDVAIVTAHVAE
jgi:light-harvesting protein B-800-850 alpha chain